MESACSVSFRFASGQHRGLHSISIVEPIQAQLHSPVLESRDYSTNVAQVLLDG